MVVFGVRVQIDQICIQNSEILILKQFALRNRGWHIRSCLLFILVIYKVDTFEWQRLFLYGDVHIISFNWIWPTEAHVTFLTLKAVGGSTPFYDFDHFLGNHFSALSFRAHTNFEVQGRGSNVLYLRWPFLPLWSISLFFVCFLCFLLSFLHEKIWAGVWGGNCKAYFRFFAMMQDVRNRGYVWRASVFVHSISGIFEFLDFLLKIFLLSRHFFEYK